MAGTVTATEETTSTMKQIKWAWTSTDGGVADGETTNYFNGKIELLTTVPGAAGAQPTDQYDITITDKNDVDVLAGAGADRSNTTNQQVVASSLGGVANSKLTLNIANAGDTKSGTVYLLLR